MARCPECNATVEWDASACPKCHVIFDDETGWTPIGENEEESDKLNELRPIRAPRKVDEIEEAAEPPDLSAVDMILAIGFGMLAIIWIPIAFITSFLFDPTANGILGFLYYLAVFAYGPVYIIAFALTRSYMRERLHGRAIKTWPMLCGGNLLFGFIVVNLTGLL